jgi:hypothetical protein
MNHSALNPVMVSDKVLMLTGNFQAFRIRCIMSILEILISLFNSLISNLKQELLILGPLFFQKLYCVLKIDYVQLSKKIF